MPKRKLVRHTYKEIKRMIRSIAEMEDRRPKIHYKEQIAELRISKAQYFRYKKKVKFLKTKSGGVSHGTSRKLKDIDIDLNPLEFCEKYMPAKPNMAQTIMIKAFYGLGFEYDEMAILKTWKAKGWTTWEPERKYKELILLAGMKGGKTTLAGFFACIEEYLLYKLGDISKHYGFTPGKETWILNVATDKAQARDTVFAATKEFIDRSPYFKKRNPKEIGNAFIFEDTNVRIQSGHSNSASLVGRNCKAVIPDELDRFKTRGGKYSADAVYKALNRSTDPFREDGHIFAISSLVNEHGIMVELFMKSKKIPTMLGFWLPEWVMQMERYAGKTFNFMGIDIPVEHKNEFDKDPEGFLRDKACMIGFTKGAYYRMPKKIDDCFEQSHNYGCKNPIDEHGRFEKWFQQKDGWTYFLHGDPSLKHDAYGIALGHRERDEVFMDLVHRIVPRVQYGEIDIEKLQDFLMDIIDRFPGIKLFTFDTWAAASVTQALRKIGIPSENLYVKKPQHDLLKEKIYSNRFKCYVHKKFIEELKELELLGDKVDHPTGGSSDVENAVAGVVWDCMHHDSGVTAAIGVSGSDEDERVSDAGFKSLKRIRRKRIWERVS